MREIEREREKELENDHLSQTTIIFAPVNVLFSHKYLFSGALDLDRSRSIVSLGERIPSHLERGDKLPSFFVLYIYLGAEAEVSFRSRSEAEPLK